MCIFSVNERYTSLYGCRGHKILDDPRIKALFWFDKSWSSNIFSGLPLSEVEGELMKMGPTPVIQERFSAYK